LPAYAPPRGSTRYDYGYVPYFPRFFGPSGGVSGGTTTVGPSMGGAATGGFRY
jgi:hypothetical protein